MRGFLILPALLVPGVALAQEQNLPDNTAIPGLMFFTLFAALAIAVGLLVLFLRRRANRDAMSRVVNDEGSAGAPRERR